MTALKFRFCQKIYGQSLQAFLCSSCRERDLGMPRGKEKERNPSIRRRYNCFVLVCGDGLSAAALYGRRMLAFSQSFEAQKRAE